MPDKLITLDNLGTFKSKIEEEIQAVANDKPIHFIKLTSSTLTEELRTEILSDDYVVVIEYDDNYYYEIYKSLVGSVTNKKFETIIRITQGSPHTNAKLLRVSTIDVYSNSVSIAVGNDNTYVPMDKITKDNVNSESATAGQVLTADGSGNTSWQDPTPTITIALTQVISQDPLTVQLTNEQYGIIVNSNMVNFDVTAFDIPWITTVTKISENDYYINFSNMTPSSSNGGYDASLWINIEKSSKEMAYTPHYYYTQSEINNIVEGLVDNFADYYDNTASYAVGDYCIMDDYLFKCNTAIGSGGETWNSSHWTRVQIVDELANGGSGGSTDVQINGTSIVSSDVANIATEGTYNASTNKIATIADTIQVKAFANTATLADIYNGGKPFIMYYNSSEYYFVKLKQFSSTYSFEFENVNGAERFDGSSVSGATTLATIIDHQGSYYAPYALASTLGNYVLSSSVVGTVSNANTNPVTSGGVYTAIAGIGSSKGLNHLTTAPSANNTDGLKIVVLSSEPATRYDGYLYIITGSNS